jgi:hypothetical protein
LFIYRLNRYQTLTDDAVCFQVLQSTAAFVAAVNSELSKLPGFDVQDTSLWDWMHCGPLGIEPISNGATLLELVLEGRWGLFQGAWNIRIGIALKNAYAAFRKFCSDARLECSQQQFTAQSLSVADGEAYQPVLKGKAHNMTCVTRWLSELLRDDTATPHRRPELFFLFCFVRTSQRSTMPFFCASGASQRSTSRNNRRNRSRVLWALASLHSVFAHGPLWLEDVEAQQVDLARRTLFGAWARLGMEPASNWPAIPKHHASQHLLKDTVATRRNPGSFWCYAGEHCMGVSKRSLGGNFQKGLDDRVLRAGLVRFGLSALDSDSRARL